MSVPQSKNAVCANLKHIVETSIKHQISGQSILMVKGCWYIMSGIVDTPFIYGRALITCESLLEFSKAKESTLHVI